MINEINSIEDCVKQNTLVTIALHEFSKSKKYLNQWKGLSGEDIEPIKKMAQTDFENTKEELCKMFNHPEISEANKSRIANALKIKH